CGLGDLGDVAAAVSALGLYRARPGRAGPVWSGRLALDQTDVARSRTLRRLCRGEVDPLSFAEQLEHRASDCASVEEVLDAALVADESETLVYEQPCDSPGRHSRSPPFRLPQGHPGGYEPAAGACDRHQLSRRATGAT